MKMSSHAPSKGRPRHGSRASTASNPAHPGWDPEVETIDPRLLTGHYPPHEFPSQNPWAGYSATVGSPFSTNEQPNGFDYGQYSQDATNQPDWSQDDGVAQADPSPAPADSNKPFVCPYSGCTNPYHPRQCDLAKHINNHTKPRKCDICGAGGAVAKDLNRHMWTHHPDEARRRGVPKEEDRCLVCGYTGRKDNVKRHRDTKNHWVSG